MVNRLAWAWAIGFGVFGVTNASASPEPRIALRLDYDAPAGVVCPTSQELGRMIASEFGYSVIREDVQPVLEVHVVKLPGRGYRAQLSGPDVSGNTERSQVVTDVQPTCRELAYDIQLLVRTMFGPNAWPDGHPPAELLVPMEEDRSQVDLGTSAVLQGDRSRYISEERVLERLRRYPDEDSEGDGLLRRKPKEPPPQVRHYQLTRVEPTELSIMVGVGPSGMAYGLPSFGLGGGGILSFRWPRFALGADVHGVVTPISGLGPENLPVRTSIWRGTVLPCARAKVFDFCAAASVGRVAFHLGDNGVLRSTEGLLVSFGARIGAGWSIAKGYSILTYTDIMVDHRSTVFSTASSQSGEITQQWRSPPVQIGFGLMLGFDLTE